MPNKVVEDMRARLAAAREATEAQHLARSDVLARIRRSLADLAAQRSQLRARRRAPAEQPAGPHHRMAAKYGLTERESEVALLLAEGASNARIAQALGISAHTARHHTRHVLTKLDVHSRAKAAAVVLRAMRKGDVRSI